MANNKNNNPPKQNKSNNPPTKKTTRIMKVTMDSDEFEKFDKGETHSDKGLRNSKGKLSALPDIEPVSENDLPKKTVIKHEYIPVETEPSIGQQLLEKVLHRATDRFLYEVEEFIYDPYKRKRAINRVKDFFNTETILEKKRKEVQKNSESPTSSSVEEESKDIIESAVESNGKEKINVTEDQAKILIESTRKKAKELSAMIFLLSNIKIKDEKTNEERILEEAYIKALISEENQNTMKLLLENKELLDADTVTCFTDFLNGYIRHEKELIPIEELEKNDNSN